jgi:hypothetical protein
MSTGYQIKDQGFTFGCRNNKFTGYFCEVVVVADYAEQGRINRNEPCLKSVVQIRASVITNWLNHYNLREVQYMAGQEFVSVRKGTEPIIWRTCKRS